MPKLSDDQRLARKLGIGASDVAELLGISPYQGASPLRLWAEKRGLLDDVPDEESIEMRVGHAIEPALVMLYQEESGWEAKLSGEYVESVARHDVEWMRCNLDGRVVGQAIGLEVKHVGFGMHDEWDLLSDDGIPHYVRVQCVWQMMVAGLEQVHVIALVCGRFRVFYVHRDAGIESLLYNHANAFWQLVVTGEQPPLDASDAARELLNRLYPSPPSPIRVEVDDEVERLMAARIAASDAESRMAERKEILNNQIREWLGKRGASDVVGVLAKASWRTNKASVRTLRVDPRGAAKKPRMPKATAITIPDLIDVDAF